MEPDREAGGGWGDASETETGVPPPLNLPIRSVSGIFMPLFPDFGFLFFPIFDEKVLVLLG